MRNFVVVVDAQADFIRADGALAVKGAEELIGPMEDWLSALRPDETAAVLFTFDTHVPEIYAGSPEAEEFPPHCERGTPGWELVVDPARVDPAIPVYRLEKGVFDMWAEPDLQVEDIRSGERVSREAFLETLRERGVGEATVIGVAADYCVRWAVAGLVDRGFAVEIPSTLTRGIERQIEAVIADEFSLAPVRSGKHA